MTKQNELIDYFLTRRSVTLPFLAAPAPSEAELETLFTIATRVPDHGKLAPWRLVTYSGDQRAQVGERLAEIYEKNFPDASEREVRDQKNQFLPAPLTVGVISRAAPHVKIPEFEQDLSAACVAFNLVHGAFALGYGAHWVSRWFSYDDDAAKMLGAREGERFVGFVHIGTPQMKLEERDRPALADVVSAWEPN